MKKPIDVVLVSSGLKLRLILAGKYRAIQIVKMISVESYPYMANRANL